mmetsp:Transcript_46145/g.81216  ORF Transcript_46145/g.81216 Transcript_46145/m.81216 type:complete len:239 (-) Transcript_46145:39-755(-)
MFRTAPSMLPSPLLAAVFCSLAWPGEGIGRKKPQAERVLPRRVRFRPGPAELHAKFQLPSYSDTFTDDEFCFCAMTGNCLDHPNCTKLGSLVECQASMCRGNGTSLDIAERTASFFNIQDDNDLLTIPRQFYKDLNEVVAAGVDGRLIILDMLHDSRVIYDVQKSGQPEYQCIHLPNCCSVRWLHLHTFTGEVPTDGLPGTEADTACAFGNQTLTEAADTILSKVHDGVCFLSLTLPL